MYVKLRQLPPTWTVRPRRVSSAIAAPSKGGGAYAEAGAWTQPWARAGADGMRRSAARRATRAQPGRRRMARVIVDPPRRAVSSLFTRRRERMRAWPWLLLGSLVATPALAASPADSAAVARNEWRAAREARFRGEKVPAMLHAERAHEAWPMQWYYAYGLASLAAEA